MATGKFAPERGDLRFSNRDLVFDVSDFLGAVRRPLGDCNQPSISALAVEGQIDAPRGFHKGSSTWGLSQPPDSPSASGVLPQAGYRPAAGPANVASSTRDRGCGAHDPRRKSIRLESWLRTSVSAPKAGRRWSHNDYCYQRPSLSSCVRSRLCMVNHRAQQLAREPWILEAHRGDGSKLAHAAFVQLRKSLAPEPPRFQPGNATPRGYRSRIRSRPKTTDARSRRLSRFEPEHA